MLNHKKTVAVIGAGISGLVCAYELQKAGFDVAVFEKEPRVGGRMSCCKGRGLPFDTGANFLVMNYTATRAYCEELGISNLCIPMAAGLNYAFKNGKLYEITSQPSRILVKNKNLSLVSRLKMVVWFLKERHAHRHLDFYDLSNSVSCDTGNAYDYVAKYAGHDVADYVIDAFTSAYQFHGAKELSLAMMLALLEMLVTDNDGFFMCHTSGGMDMLPEALAKKLRVSRGCQCSRVFAENGGVSVTLPRGISHFDAAVLATTADVSKRIYANPTRRQEDFLARVAYAATVNVSFLVPKALLENLGLVMVPEAESAKISEYTDEAMKGTELIKDGKALVNVGLHDAYAKKALAENDENIFSSIKEELLRVCPLLKDHAGQIENYDLKRWPVAMPKYYPGYLTDTKNFLENGQGSGHVFFCGDYLNSPWIEGSVRCGQRVAKRVQESLE